MQVARGATAAAWLADDPRGRRVTAGVVVRQRGDDQARGQGEHGEVPQAVT